MSRHTEQVHDSRSQWKVIPYHDNCPDLFSRKQNPADDVMFRNEVEAMGYQCAILQPGDSLEPGDT